MEGELPKLETEKANGYTRARGIVPVNETCEIARHLIADKEYPIDRLLDAYDDPDEPVPILPHPRCPNFQIDGGGGVGAHGLQRSHLCRLEWTLTLLSGWTRS